MQSTWLDETINAVVAGLNTAVYVRDITPRAPSTRRRKTGKQARKEVDTHQSKQHLHRQMLKWKRYWRVSCRQWLYDGKPCLFQQENVER